MYIKRNFSKHLLPLFLCLFFPLSSAAATRAAQEIWIIAHGTFAKNSAWSKPGGDFYTTLKQHIAPHAHIYEINWSGKNSDTAREEAGIAAARFIKTIMQPGDRLHGVGHSHGGNVLILAAHQLAKEKSPLYMESLFTLGTPICTKSYLPDMSHIKYLYNLFSYGDRIQPVMQIFQRVFPEHERIFNIQVQCNGLCPTHMQMRQPLIAQHLPHISKLIKNQKKPLLIHFFDKKKAIVILDSTREKDLAIDKRFTEQILMCITESRHGKRTSFITPKLSFQNWPFRFRNRGRLNPE